MLSPSQIHLYPYFHFFITCFLKNIFCCASPVRQWTFLIPPNHCQGSSLSSNILRYLQSYLFRSSCGASAKISFLIPQFKVILKLFLKIFSPQFLSSFFIFKRLSCEAGCKCKTLFFVSKPSYTFFWSFFQRLFAAGFWLHLLRFRSGCKSSVLDLFSKRSSVFFWSFFQAFYCAFTTAFIFNDKGPINYLIRPKLYGVGGDLLSHPGGSTIGAMELNFSVRNGKRWDLHAITTNNSYSSGFPELYFFIDNC